MQIKEFKIDSLEFSPGSEDLFVLDYTLNQINASTVTLSAKYELKEELDNSYVAQLTISMVTRGNAFFEVYRTKPQGVCDLIKSFGSKISMDVPEMCPIPPIEGSIEDEVLNFESLMGSGIAGRFKTDITLKQDGVEKLKATMILQLKWVQVQTKWKTRINSLISKMCIHSFADI